MSENEGFTSGWIVNGSSIGNFSSNDTGDYSEEDSEELSLVSKVVYGVIIPIMTVVCITGNILTIASYCQDRKLRTVHNTYLLSLAFSDLLVGCVSMPFYAVYTLMSYQWPFGTAFCKIFMSIDFLACLESVFVIILVSFDRVMLLMQGVEYSLRQTMRVAKIRIASSWILAFLVYVPAVVFWDIARGFSSVKEGDCDVEFFDDFGFTIITSVIEFVLPLIIVLTLNIYLYSLIRRNSKDRPGQSLAVRSEQSQRDTSTESIEISRQSALSKAEYGTTKQRIILKRERKAARSLAALVSVFTVCWLPYTICTVIIAFCGDCVNKDLYEVFNWLLWWNSTLNPFLYAFTNVQFRMNFIRLLKLQRCRFRQTKVAPHRIRTVDTASCSCLTRPAASGHRNTAQRDANFTM